MNGRRSPVAVWLGQVGILVRKELLQIVRDRALLLFTVYIFTLDILLAAGNAGFDVRHAPIGIVDLDRSAASRELVYRFRAPHFEARPLNASPDAAGRLLDEGAIHALLEIGPGFERSLQRGQEAPVQLVIDGSKATLGYLIESYGERILAQESAGWAAARLAREGVDARSLPQVRLQPRTWYNADLRETWFATISELVTMMTVAAIFLPAAALIREKERGTIEQLLVSPLAPLQIVLAKVFAMTLVMLAGAAVAVGGIMVGLLDVPFRGSPVLFFALLALYAVTTSGLGIVAATFARNSGQVGLIVLLIVMPILFLSGSWNLVEGMPAWLRAGIELSPLRHFVPIAYGIVLRGTGLDAIWPSVVKMLALGTTLFAVGVWRFRRQFR
ncbi:ABC transporter permease [Piscinibacter defluvii]|uniref:ABC transporter permease n=1 Tax=Piscinibacter defluvii TaxID=1796922 RepID=UPI0013E3B036|nr:ABC transporter permease [Piscinibacter defluvii]